MKAVFFDLDGTLLCGEKISEANITAMKKVQTAGNKLIMNTGRSLAFIPQVAAECVEWDGRICGNSYIEYGGAVLDRKVLDRDQLAVIYDFCVEKKIPCKFEGEEAIYTLSFEEDESNILQYQLKNYTEYPWRKMERKYIEQGEKLKITKITLCEAVGKKYAGCFPGMYLIDMGHYVEIVCNGYNKATGMKLIGEKLGISQGNMVAFGDSMNDVEMLKYAGIGVIMPHAPKELESSTICRVTCEEEGVAEGLYEIFPELW
ncbi:MAG: HAD family phosphatase [Ruminococcaceae bacterium]|nr:HAD family phosphatase [Oscillospiraceae bacterium]